MVFDPATMISAATDFILLEGARLCAGDDTFHPGEAGTNVVEWSSQYLDNMSAKAHILIVDDSPELREAISGYLRAHGYRATVAADAKAARDVLKSSDVSLAVIDVMMPGEDGLTLCRSLRSEGSLPIIILTARGEEVDRIVGLEMGADDYLAKPCNPRELLARIGSVLRRANLTKQGGRATPRLVRFDVWELDLERHELIGQSGGVVPLSSGEYRLLVALLEHAGSSLSRDFLLDVTQHGNAESYDRSVDSAISRLRRKIKDDPRSPRLIKTQYGGGYMIDIEAQWC